MNHENSSCIPASMCMVQRIRQEPLNSHDDNTTTLTVTYVENGSSLILDSTWRTVTWLDSTYLVQTFFFQGSTQLNVKPGWRFTMQDESPRPDVTGLAWCKCSLNVLVALMEHCLARFFCWLFLLSGECPWAASLDVKKSEWRKG